MPEIKSQYIPRSVIKTSREELDYDRLRIYQQDPGESTGHEIERLPDDLHGYVFTVGALFQAEDRPQEDGTLLYTGDGMIYRLGLENGRASLKTRIAKTPCYYADVPTQLYLADATSLQRLSRFAKKHAIFSYFSAFRDGGQSRFSILLGARNQLNTAFLRTRDHLLVTIDAGRPHIVDPETLELVEPTGEARYWRGIFPFVGKLQKQYLFDVYSNSAHPLTDLTKIGADKADEFYTTNYSTGYNGKFRKPVNALIQALRPLYNFLVKEKAEKDDFGLFTFLVRYRFRDKINNQPPELKRWRMLLPDRSPVLVEQSLHQLGITEKYIILSDITFRMEFSQIFSPFFFGFLRFSGFKDKTRLYSIGAFIYAKFLRQLKPLPYGALYIIDREDLEKNPDATEVIVQKTIIPREISHFAADYDNPDGKITIHIGHNNGADVTEGITRYDRSVSTKPNTLREDLEGMMTGTTDRGSLGRYVIDGRTGHLDETQLVSGDPATWALTVFTHRDLGRDSRLETEKTVKNVYWMSWGFSWELIPQRIYDQYKNDPDRTIKVEDLPDDRRPATLLRLDTQTQQIVDTYEFPKNCFVVSPQFVPSARPTAGKDPSVDGYIVCIVLKDDTENPELPRDQFWILHADDFNGQPIYRLGTPLGEKPLNIALTLHTTWIPRLFSEGTPEERMQRRRDSIDRDYEQVVKDTWPVVQELYREIVRPNFIAQTLETDFESQLRQ
jgi:carotenoid cleavage dioxygenase-like enzyme